MENTLGTRIICRAAKVIVKVVKTGPDVKPVEILVQGLKVGPGFNRC
jgi:hypothetical protein